MKTLLLLLTLVIGAAAQSADGKAIVYIYSLATFTTLGKVKKPVFINGKEAADIRPEHDFIALLEPGNHSIHLKNKKFGGVEKEFAAGTTYYVRMEWRNNGMALVPQNITLVNEENGAFDIKELRPVDKENIKDPLIVVLSVK